MTFKLGSMLLVALIVLVALIGCDGATRDLVLATVPSTDAEIDTMPPMDTDMDDVTPDEAAAPVKLVWLINYPLGGKDAYIAWVASVAPTLQAPEELKRVASYDSFYGENPHRLVEFEFGSFADAMTYLNRPDIAAIIGSLPDHASESSTYVFIQRSDYSKSENSTRKLKVVYLIDYPLGGKAAYLEWVASNALTLSSPAELKRVASYDNYYGESPHRLVEFEFDSIEDANAYQEREGIRAINVELPNRTSRVAQLTFELRSDYVNE